MTASAQLIQQQPQSTGSSASWNASCATLDRLFLLSSKLELGSELTPIQAWNELWKTPFAPYINQQDLEDLKQDLSKAIACYG